MQLNPARGRKLVMSVMRLDMVPISRFMQLNPARGRKHVDPHTSIFFYKVYAAQPREGTETLAMMRAYRFLSSSVYAAQPREGTETTHSQYVLGPILGLVYAAQPREGTETCFHFSPPLQVL